MILATEQLNLFLRHDGEFKMSHQILQIYIFDPEKLGVNQCRNYSRATNNKEEKVREKDRTREEN